MATIRVNDARGGDYVTFDGEFIEKLPAKADQVRRHVSDLTDVKIVHKPVKKKLFGGQSEERWEVLIHCGMFISLWVGAEQKSKLDELVVALEAAKQRS